MEAPQRQVQKGGPHPAVMPLYNSELIASWPEGCRIVLVEGETPAEALRVRGIRAVGTVCGAALPLNGMCWRFEAATR